MAATRSPVAERALRRTLFVLAGVAVLVVMLLLAYQIWSGHREARAEAAATAYNYAAIIEARLDATLRRTDGVLNEIARELPATALTPAGRQDYAPTAQADLDRGLHLFPELAAMRIYDRAGNRIYGSSADQGAPASIAEQPFFRDLATDAGLQFLFARGVRTDAGGRRLLSAARALRDAHGRLDGVVLAELDLNHFVGLFRTLDIGRWGMVELRRTDDFRLMARWPEPEAWTDVPLPAGHALRLALAGPSAAGSIEADATPADGLVRIHSWHRLHGYPFAVIVAIGRDEALAGWRARSLAVGLSAVLLFALLYGLLARLWRMQTEASATLEALERSEERLRLALAASQQGLYDLDLRTGEAVVNAEYAQMLGYDPATFRETTPAWLERLHPDDRALCEQVLQDYVEGRRDEYRVEFRQRRRDGSYLWTLSVGKIVERDAQGRPLRMLGTHLDINESRVAEAQLRSLAQELESRVERRTAELVAARDEAERANRAKSEFLSSISHELRTPLNAIIGFAQLLDADPALRSFDRQQRHVGEILRAGRHLLELIDDLLDLARIEAGRQELVLEPVDLEGLIVECLQLMEPSAREAGVELPAAAPACAQCVARADRVRLKQVLLNLLSNAVKYNRPEGRVEIACVTEGGTVRISVSDTGRGLDPRQQAQLFTAFERLQADRAGIKGAGIGLVLSKRLVELMGGEIGVTSALGVGSTFWVRLPGAGSSSLPAASVASAPAPEPQAAEGDRRRVLYIEDNEVNIALLEAVFDRHQDLQLLTAAEPEDGLELARTRHPDLILLDIQLPGIDGYEVLRRLRADASTRDIPVMAVTANAMPQDFERARAAGFLSYLTKPLDLPALVVAVRQALAERAPRSPS